ncbi:MAG: tetratricopeptide repeat protein [Candidatus Saganbacteria bacterium]|nr:tetratricopeptide repeat protein [Candidatus Saganbacteria bacterium]
MVNEINQAKTYILTKYPRIVEEGGADLDGDGEVKGTEKFVDFNGNGQVGDSEDFWLYLEKNRPILKIDTVFLPQEGFSAGNIIHKIIEIESPLFKPEEVSKAYKILDGVLAEVKARVTEGMSEKEKLLLVYQVLAEKKYILRDQDDISFISNLLRGELDCDTSSFVALAVAQELDIPAQLVILPEHVFIRLADGTNIDAGKTHPDKFYFDNFPGVKEINTSTPKEVLAYVYGVRAEVWRQRNNYAAAETDSSRAIELDPNYALSYGNRAWIRFRQGNYAGALEDCNQALNRDPLPEVKVTVLFFRAQIYYLQGKYAEAKQDCGTLSTFNLDPGSRKKAQSLFKEIRSEQRKAETAILNKINTSS